MKTDTARSILYTITFLRREPLRDSIKFLERSQWWNSNKYRDYQEEKLNLLIRHAATHVPFYKNNIKNISDCGLKSLSSLPIIDKNILRNNVKQFIAIDYKEPTENAKTSGSTGIPLHFPKSLKSSAFQRAAMYRGHLWHGIEPGAKEARLWGIPVNTSMRMRTRLNDIVLNRFREREYNINPEVLDDFSIRLEKRKPVYLMGYTSMVTQYAKYLFDKGKDGRQFGLKMVKCTSETIHDGDREIIEKVFGCSLVGEYGAAEAGLIAFQCEKGSYHLMSDCCIVEFVEPQDSVGDPDLKEVVVTNLDNFALPVIRYRIGDYAIPSEDKCTCGRALPVVKKIIGRVSDIIKASDGRRWHSIILYYIMKGLDEKNGGVAQFKVFQNNHNELDFLLVPNRKYLSSTEDYLRTKCLEHFGREFKINIRISDYIPREPSGKLRDFVSTI